MSYFILRFFLLLYSFACLFTLTGCSGQSFQEGVVARVNGEPIYLEEVQAVQDEYYYMWSHDLPSDLQEIKSSYGNILLELIVQKLVNQEMLTRSLSISQEELAGQEKKIRGDYPEGQFKKMLIEEYIDLDLWRRQLKQNLVREKFILEVLRPGISLDVEEIKEYYNANMENFYIPERIRFVHMTSPEENRLKDALDFFGQTRELSKTQKKFPEVNTGQYEMRIDQLPQILSRDLDALDPGQHSSIKSDGSKAHYVIYVLERKQGALLKPHQVYDIIEDKLVEIKLQQALHLWLEKAVINSTIEINQNLLRIIASG